MPCHRAPPRLDRPQTPKIDFHSIAVDAREGNRATRSNKQSSDSLIQHFVQRATIHRRLTFFLNEHRSRTRITHTQPTNINGGLLSSSNLTQNVCEAREVDYTLFPEIEQNIVSKWLFFSILKLVRLDARQLCTEKNLCFQANSTVNLRTDRRGSGRTTSLHRSKPNNNVNSKRLGTMHSHSHSRPMSTAKPICQKARTPSGPAAIGSLHRA